ncbi:MAG TPA: hypothetical protein DEA46_06070 [Candidatus Moranbacteria bacterium]|nr:hypothetical protein [Candidatus Moranbacteria bacterium]
MFIPNNYISYRLILKFVFILLITLIFQVEKVQADGTVTVQVGNGIGSYNSAVDDFGSSGGVTDWANITTKSYRAIYPNLDQLLGNNKTVTSVSWNLWYRYDSDGTGENYSLYFYNAREGDSAGTPIYTYTGWQSKPGGIYYSFDIPNSLIQEWIDTPANNNGISLDRGVSGTGFLVFGALDNVEITRRPYLEITYSYTGDIAPQKTYFTSPTTSWSVKGDVQLGWDFYNDCSLDPATFTVQIDVQPDGGSWTTLANAVLADLKEYTWDTSGYATGKYNVRIRSETNDLVFSEWTLLDGQVELTEDYLSVVEVNNLEKIEKFQSVEIPENSPTPSWWAAKGEGEALQLDIIPHTDLTGVALTLDTFSDGNGHTISPTIYVAKYVEASMNTHITGTVGTSGFWPDALIPTVDPIWGETRNSSSIDVENYSNQPIYIDVLVPIDQPAGIYTGNLIINGNEFSEQIIPLEFTVRNFAIPATSGLKSNNIIDQGRLNTWHINNASTKDAIQQGSVDLWKMYRNYFLKYRMSIDPGGWTAYKTNWDTRYSTTSITSNMNIPYFNETVTGNPETDRLTTAYSMGVWWPYYDSKKILIWDEGTQSNIPNPALTIWDEGTQQYITPNPSITEPSDEAYQDTFSTVWNDMVSRGWDAAGFIYLADEPKNYTFDAVGKKAQLIKSANANFKTLVTSGLRRDNADGQQSLAYYDPWIDIWVPVINLFGSNNDSQGTEIETLDAARANGDEVWTYTSNMSINDAGAPAYFIDMDTGVYARILNWLAWLYDLDGILYFDTVASWNSATNPYNDVFRYNGNGDGTLWYPGATGFIGGSHGIPIPSTRLNYIRDGFEDWEYLKLLKSGGEDIFINNIVSQMIPVDRDAVVDGKALAIRNWENDPNLMQALRSEMADKIEQGLNISYRSDVDNSSVINTTDALLTLRNSLGLSMDGTAWQVGAMTGDVDCSGSSNSTDALLILRYSLGLSMDGTSWCE